MAILREWRAEIRRTLKQEYVDYVTATGIAGYRRAEGKPWCGDCDARSGRICLCSWSS